MIRADLKGVLEEARHRFHVPGMTAAIYMDGKEFTEASGVTNVVTGIQMTTDSIAHIGSITKIFNATLVMQLVDEGRLELERPAIEYVPDLRLGDMEAAHSITVEQLLNHTSGIDGNLLPDAGHDEETIEKTVRRFAAAGQLHAPGAARSYCNAGTVIAGYLCQRVTGDSWYDLMKKRIFMPLEIERAAVLPEDALLHRYSVGHFVDAGTGEARRTQTAFLPLGYSPAGSTAMLSATSLMTFLRAHVAGGVGPNGKRIISTETQSISDWAIPQRYAGESTALTTGYRDTSDGMEQAGPFNLYEYTFTLDPTKVVSSLTLPNDANVEVLAATLVPAGTTQVNLSSIFNRTGIVADGTNFGGGGLDSGGAALSSNLLGTSLTSGGTTFDFGPAGSSDVVSAAGQSIALPAGNDSALKLLATGVNGSQPNQTFTVTYTDGTTATFTQSISDWAIQQRYAGESTALATGYRDTSDGMEQAGPFNLYEYTFTLDPTKVVSSLTLPNDANVEVLAIDVMP